MPSIGCELGWRSFKAWRHDLDEEDDARTVAGRSAESAAQEFAEFCHSHRSGWEWSWPIDVMVREVATGKLARVMVARDMVPVFLVESAVLIEDGTMSVASTEDANTDANNTGEQ